MKKKLSDIDVLGKPYKFEYIKHTAIGSEDYGACDFARQVISIAAGIAFELEQDTAIHEVFHVIDYTADLKLTERQVTVLASLFLTVLKTNPNFADYITR